MAQKRPLFASYQDVIIPALLLIMAGAWLASAASLAIAFWAVWLLLGLGGFLGSLLFSSQRQCVKWFVWWSCFFLGGSYFMAIHFVPGPLDVSNKANLAQAELQGVIVSPGATSEKWVVKVTQLNHAPTQGQILMKLKKNLQLKEPLDIGDHVTLVGRLYLPYSPLFPGQFDYRAYLLQQKITAMFTAQQCTITQDHPSTWWLALLRETNHLSQRITTHFKQHLSLSEAQILASVVLGDHAVDMSSAIKADFIRAGLIHVLAASGFNVGLIAACFLIFGKVFRLPLRLSLGIAMVGVAGYCLLTGLPPSVQRAGMMLELAFLFKIIQRELTPVTLLCLVGVILTFINPMVVMMLGFQLSFLSTLGLIVMVRPLQEILGFYLTRWGAGILLVPLVAQLWVTPILMYQFNQVQLVALPANLLALPLVSILTYVGFILGAGSLIWPTVTGWLIARLGFLCTMLHQIASFFGHLPFSIWHVPSPPVTTMVLFMGLLFFWAYGVNFPAKVSPKTLAVTLSIGLLLLISPVALAKWQAHHQTSITWLPHRFGSGTQVIDIQDRTVVVNVVNLDTYDAKDLQNYLVKQGVARIDILNLMSPKATNLMGLSTLVANGVAVHHITSPGLTSQKALAELNQLKNNQNISVTSLAATHQIVGHSLSANFFDLYPTETLQRFNWGALCFVNHWGGDQLQQSPLVAMANGCLIRQDINDQGFVHLFLGQDTIPITFNRFYRLVVQGDNKTIQLVSY